MYQTLVDAGFDILFDDRGQRPGVAFADMDLIGIPHRLILGERGLDEGSVEYKRRADGHSAEFAIDDVVTELQQLMAS
jgi:prolyl-tRNA synthetase